MIGVPLTRITLSNDDMAEFEAARASWPTGTGKTESTAQDSKSVMRTLYTDSDKKDRDNTKKQEHRANINSRIGNSSSS